MEPKKNQQSNEKAKHHIFFIRLCLIGILIISIIALSGCLKRTDSTKESISEKSINETSATNLSKGAVSTASPIKNIKVVSIYERIIGKRPVDDSIGLLLKADTDFVFRGFFKMDSNWGYGKDNTLYNKLADAISKLKAKNPSILFQGAINAAYLDPADSWADGTPLSEDDINKMIVFVNGQPIKRDRPHLPKGIDYAADIANPKYRDYIVGWSEKQIDSGVDSLFYDEPFINIKYKVKTTEEYKDLLVTYEDLYWKDIVDRVKSYAASKGKTVYITANQNYKSVMELHPWKYVDIVTVQLKKEDLVEMRATENWDLLKDKVRKTHGEDIPIIVFLDWANDPELPLGVFAKMNTDDQKQFLELIDKATKDNGILFAYPMHGGEPGIQKTGSQFNGVYDSIEYGTYDTIVELAKERNST